MFKNALLDKIAEEIGVEHKVYSSPYHPQSNGKIEAFHYFLKACIAKHMTQLQDWDEVVPLACAAYNFLLNEYSRESPFLGGLSLHLNHLIASCVANYDWPFGTLSFRLFGSNLDTRDLETYPRTYSGHF